MAKRFSNRPWQKGQTISKSATLYRKQCRKIQQMKLLPRLLLVASFVAVVALVQFNVQVSDWLGLYDAGKTAAVDPAQDGETQIHFIDVGQGDATLIAQSGEYALIDAGVTDATEDLLLYLESLGVETIEVFVMTHPHADHIGAMDEIIEQFDVKTVVMPDFTLVEDAPTTASYERVLTALENSDAVIETATVGDCYTVGQGRLEIISTGVTTDNYNDISVCTIFTVGAFSMLNTGDAETALEQAILESGIDIQASVFQAGHHGSSTSNALDFLQAVQPELVVISCGLNNSYGHPDGQTLANIEAVGADCRRTDLNGNVVVTYTAQDGMQIICETEIA